MPDTGTELIDVSQLRIGIYVVLDLHWISHPFSLSAFRIASQDQIDTIRSLGLQRVRYDPARSELPVRPPVTVSEAAPPRAQAVVDPRQEALARQRASLRQCEKQFSEATSAYRRIAESARVMPSRELSESLVRGLVDRIFAAEELSIRLLSEQVGERSAQHSVNVSVIALLLARACGLAEQSLLDIGVGALLHDIGKVELPDRLRWRDEHFSSAELQIFQEHVAHGVRLGKAMGVSAGALLIIGQHHERADGSGYPQQTRSSDFAAASRLVALVNHYDRLCNPPLPASALTPHEALSQIFTQMNAQFGSPLLASFIRMMGVYPPGSVVQLSDDRHALVVSVNSSRPLKPSVIVHDPAVPPEQALVVDLERESGLGIRRSLKPQQLPRAALDYLMPRTRICYFFERAREPGEFGEFGSGA
jgi:putative nucleotidyltransferase with HDIG domain